MVCRLDGDQDEGQSMVQHVYLGEMYRGKIFVFSKRQFSDLREYYFNWQSNRRRTPSFDCCLTSALWQQRCLSAWTEKTAARSSAVFSRGCFFDALRSSSFALRSAVVACCLLCESLSVWRVAIRIRGALLPPKLMARAHSRSNSSQDTSKHWACSISSLDLRRCQNPPAHPLFSCEDYCCRPDRSSVRVARRLNDLSGRSRRKAFERLVDCELVLFVGCGKVKFWSHLNEQVVTRTAEANLQVGPFRNFSGLRTL
jgi:hypothetical protein